jgi:anti-anti-sigma factor
MEPHAILLETSGDLRIRGTVDVSVAQELLEAARGASLSTTPISVDCTELERLDTATVQILVALCRKQQARGASVRLKGVSPAVRAFLELLGATSALPLEASS